MTRNANVWAVQGFKVETFTSKKDQLKIVLTANKEEISAQDGNISDVLASLELHQSGEVEVELTLGRVIPTNNL